MDVTSSMHMTNRARREASVQTSTGLGLPVEEIIRLELRGAKWYRFVKELLGLLSGIVQSIFARHLLTLKPHRQRHYLYQHVFFLPLKIITRVKVIQSSLSKFRLSYARAGRCSLRSLLR